MERLTPPLLIILRELRWKMTGGSSFRTSILNITENSNSALGRRVHELIILRQQRGSLDFVPFSNPHQRAFWDLAVRSLDGHPILEPLANLESDVEAAALHDLDVHLTTLPFKALVPLLFCQFPAFVILLLWPLLRELPQ